MRRRVGTTSWHDDKLLDVENVLDFQNSRILDLRGGGIGVRRHNSHLT
jgi:hypothetical protein